MSYNKKKQVFKYVAKKIENEANVTHSKDTYFYLGLQFVFLASL